MYLLRIFIQNLRLTGSLTGWTNLQILVKSRTFFLFLSICSKGVNIKILKKIWHCHKRWNRVIVKFNLNSSVLDNFIVCKNFTVQTLLLLLEIIIQKKLWEQPSSAANKYSSVGHREQKNQKTTGQIKFSMVTIKQ